MYAYMYVNVHVPDVLQWFEFIGKSFNSLIAKSFVIGILYMISETCNDYH